MSGVNDKVKNAVESAKKGFHMLLRELPDEVRRPVQSRTHYFSDKVGKRSPGFDDPHFDETPDHENYGFDDGETRN